MMLRSQIPVDDEGRNAQTPILFKTQQLDISLADTSCLKTYSQHMTNHTAPWAPPASHSVANSRPTASTQ
jgi:hypothetical protein